MASKLYTPFDYSLGASETQSQAQAHAKLQSMKGSLRKWLKFRATMDDYVQGKSKRPKKKWKIPPGQVAKTQRHERYPIEQKLATQLFDLLVASGCDPRVLPVPDVSRNPDAAANLASLVIDSKVCGPGQTPGPQAQGIIWLLAIPVAAATMLAYAKIKSDADLAMKQEENRCIMAGGCTDTGFWLKVASVSVIAWLVWDKFGGKEAATKTRKRIAT
jgi:hypothetical protein